MTTTTRPTVRTDWATDPTLPGGDIQEPGAAQRFSGWTFEQVMPRNLWNGLLNLLGLWLRYIDENNRFFDDLSDAVDDADLDVGAYFEIRKLATPAAVYGARIWDTLLGGGGGSGEPVHDMATDGRRAYAASNSALRAMNLKTGVQEWVGEISGEVHWRCATDGEVVAVIDKPDTALSGTLKVYAVSGLPDSGSDLDGQNIATPLYTKALGDKAYGVEVAGGLVVVVGDFGVKTFASVTGAADWTATPGGTLFDVTSDGRSVFVWSGSGVLRYNLATGNLDQTGPSLALLGGQITDLEQPRLHYQGGALWTTGFGALYEFKLQNPQPGIGQTWRINASNAGAEADVIIAEYTAASGAKAEVSQAMIYGGLYADWEARKIGGGLPQAWALEFTLETMPSGGLVAWGKTTIPSVVWDAGATFNFERVFLTTSMTAAPAAEEEWEVVESFETVRRLDPYTLDKIWAGHADIAPRPTTASDPSSVEGIAYDGDRVYLAHHRDATTGKARTVTAFDAESGEVVNWADTTTDAKGLATDGVDLLCGLDVAVASALDSATKLDVDRQRRAFRRVAPGNYDRGIVRGLVEVVDS